MSKFIYVFLLLCSCFPQWVTAQKSVFLTEKVYIAPASSPYFRGDTLQIEGQLLSSDYEDFYPYSRYVYIELLNNNDSVLVQQKLKCEPDGSFYATLPLDYEWTDTIFYLRGYSQFMQNAPNRYFPTTPLLIGNRQSLCATSPLSVEVHFFPEGGKWITGKIQKAAICLTDEYNRPIQTKFYIINSRQDTITFGESYLSGWGSFALSPQDGEYYQLKIHTNGQEHSYPLPAATDNVSLQVNLHNGRLICKVLPSSNEKTSSYHLYAYHSYFGLQELSIQGDMALADVSSCAPGIITVWLTDEAGHILAERNHQWKGEATTSHKVTVSVPEKCRIGEIPVISIHDTIPGSRCIVRIVPEQDNTSTQAFENLQFLHRLYSPLPFPQFYHREEPEKAQKELDAWLLSTTSESFALSDLQADSIPYPFFIEKNLLLKGNVKRQNGKPVGNGNVQLFHTASQKSYTVHTDSTGSFGVIVEDFADKDGFFLQAYDKKGRIDNYCYCICEPTFPHTPNKNHYRMHSSLPISKETATKGGKIRNFNTDQDGTKVYELSDVTVKAKAIRKNEEARLPMKTPLNYIDRETIDHSAIVTLENIILRFTKVHLTKAGARDTSREGIKKEKGRVICWTMPPTISFTPSAQGHGAWLDLVIDGLLINREYEDFFSMSAADIESVELVSYRDSRCIIYGAPYGFLNIKRRTSINKDKTGSNGVAVYPKGISYPTRNHTLKMPSQPGAYRLLIDVISPDRKIYSFDKPIKIDL